MNDQCSMLVVQPLILYITNVFVLTILSVKVLVYSPVLLSFFMAVYVCCTPLYS